MTYVIFFPQCIQKKATAKITKTMEQLFLYPIYFHSSKMNKSFQTTLPISHSSLLSSSALNFASDQEIFEETFRKQYPCFSTSTEPSSVCLTPRAVARSHAGLNNVQVVPVFISQYKTYFLLNYFNLCQDLGALQHCWLQHLQSCAGLVWKGFFSFFTQVNKLIC